MSYKCDNCNNVHRGRQLKKAVEVRDVVYEKFYETNDYRTKEIQEVFVDRFTGREIAKERIYCQQCFNEADCTAPVVQSDIKIVKQVTAKPKVNKKLDLQNEDDRKD